jgi:hypothetical protein
VGRRPARTVYEITGEGRLELEIQRDAALDVIFGSADPVSVVLLFAAGGGMTDLRERLAARSRRVAVQLKNLASERTRLTAQGPAVSAGGGGVPARRAPAGGRVAVARGVRVTASPSAQ